MDFPLLTADLPGTGGALKDRPEDFVVDEIPLYPALGVGDHAYARVEKTGISTREAIRRLAQHLGISESAVGCAGLKDARAVTRQTLSLEHVPPARLEGLELPGLRVLSVKRHRNKLRPGHLAGNRFEVRVRGVGPAAAESTAAVLRVILARGLPNGFGPQRFGTRGDTHLVGLSLLRPSRGTRASWRRAGASTPGTTRARGRPSPPPSPRSAASSSASARAARPPTPCA